MSAPKYKRVLLKLSGEAFAGPDRNGISGETILAIAEEVKKAWETGVQIGIVIGAGNIVRGASLALPGLNRTVGDNMGMLGTVINCLALMTVLKSLGVPARVMTAIEMNKVAEFFTAEKAVEHLEQGQVVIFGGGTGNPFFTTDTASALKALEIGADVMLKATNVDGVYTADPKKDPSAVKFDTLSQKKALDMGLKVMDGAAFALCRDNKLPIIVFDIKGQGNIMKAASGEKIGTFVCPEE
ncbi:MAG: UMP kinase [Armatimonadetes bacterium]|nr:UMP kinase [Candidatus Hippobium faecium]